MSSPSSPGSEDLFRHRPFLYYFAARGFSKFSYQIAVVAVGWQVYALTGSAFDLGMVGLMQFIPTALLTFAAGHAADRYDRKRVVQICQTAEALVAAFLAWGSFGGWLNVPEIFAAVTVFGIATAFESPATAALLPAVVPEGYDRVLDAGGIDERRHHAGSARDPQRDANAQRLVRRCGIRPQQSCDIGDDIARSIRCAARRSNRTDANLCP